VTSDGEIPPELEEEEEELEADWQAQQLEAAEMADKLGADLIAMGRKGLGNTEDNFGHVTQKVLKLTSKPVVLLN